MTQPTPAQIEAALRKAFPRFSSMNKKPMGTRYYFWVKAVSKPTSLTGYCYVNAKGRLVANVVHEHGTGSTTLTLGL